VAFGKALRTTLLLASGLALIGYATGYLHLFPTTVALAWASGLPFALTGCQLILRRMLPQAQRALNSETSVVICGANAVGLRLANHFHQHRDLGERFVGFFDDRDPSRLRGIGRLPVLGQIKHLAGFVKRNKVQRVFVTLPMASQPRVLNLIEGLRDTTASVYFVPDIFITPLINGHVETMSGLPVISVCDTPFRGFNGLLKRLEDIVVATLVLVLTSPLLLAVAIGVRLSGPGPIVFRQRRYGLDGRDVWVYKFRSMRVTEDGDREFRAADRGDPRVTRFGAFIRRTSLDELPQFLNVLQGRMSVVGPRPHAVAMNEEFRRLIPSYMLRHKVKPGITGLAQVRGYRGGSDLEHMRKRIACDIEYLRRASFGLDLSIILRTVVVVLRDQRAY
jgi:putative colanic acid biosynthesis UDP-glucose lipid carrier transferase